MTSDVDVVYDARKGKLFLNTNGEEKGGGKKTVGGLIAWAEGKPALSAVQVEAMEAFDAVTGDHGHSHHVDGKEQIASCRETLTDSEQADYLVSFTLKPKKTLTGVIKDVKKDGYVSDPDERDEELDEMTKGGSFIDIELDAAVLQAMFSQGSEQERERARKVADSVLRILFRERHSRHDL